jgi:hypothetical protein
MWNFSKSPAERRGSTEQSLNTIDLIDLWKCINYVTELNYFIKLYIQRDSKRWTQFSTSLFPELYMVMWMIYITFEKGGPKFSNTTARALTYLTAVHQRQLRAKWLLCSRRTGASVLAPEMS